MTLHHIVRKVSKLGSDVNSHPSALTLRFLANCYGCRARLIRRKPPRFDDERDYLRQSCRT